MSKPKNKTLFSESLVNQIPKYFGIQDIHSKFQLATNTGSKVDWF